MPHLNRRYWTKVVWVAVTLIALGAFLVLAGYLYLPKMVTNRLPVAQIKRLGFADFTGRVSRIGLHQTTAGPFIFGHTDQPALAIHFIELNYTPGELQRKKVGRVRFSDVVVNAVLDHSGFSFPGLDLNRVAADGDVSQSPAVKSPVIADVVVEKIEVRGGMINLTWRSATYKIPFEAELKPDGKDMLNLDAHIRLFPRDQHLAVTVRVAMDNRTGRVTIGSPAIALDGFADLIHLIPGLDATGIVSGHASVRLTWAPFSLSNANVDLVWHSGRSTYASVILAPGQGGVPGTLSACSANLNTWQIRADGMQLDTPATIGLNALAVTANLDDGLWSGDGNAQLTVFPFSFKGQTPIAIEDSLSLPVTFDAAQKAPGEWIAGFSTTPNKPSTPSDRLELVIGGAKINSGIPRFSLTAKSDGRVSAADWQLDLDAIRTTTAQAIVNLPSAGAKGQLQFEDGPHGPIWSGDARIQLATPTLDARGMTGKLDALTVSVRIQQKGSGPPRVDARMNLSNGRFHHLDSGLDLSGGRLDLPFQAGLEAAGSHGTFSVDRIVYQKRPLGKIYGRILQTKDAYGFAATHFSDLFPGMTAAFTGTVRTHGSRIPIADFNLEIPPYQLPAGSDLIRFIPAAKGVVLSGTVSAQGKASISSTGVSGDVDVNLKGGTLTVAEKKIVVTGIDAALRFPEFPHIRSSPAQLIRFARAALGDIVVDGGSVEVQVESQKTVLIEKGRLSWCDGKVDVGSLRLTSGHQEYDVSLYCQRLNLSRILEQLGAVNARGTGTVNGRIPIVYNHGNIRFDDGFLFSTPGEGGRIQITGTDLLTRGIAPGTPQFAQVELAQAALEDYAYTWAKLGLLTEGEDFLMRLQFDGKPANPLPFVYQKEVNRFVRVEAGAQGSIFQGIGLDVNVKLPLNQLLQYKDMVNMID